MNFLNHNQSKNHPAPVLFPKDTWKHKSRVVAIPLIALLIVGGIAWYGVRERAVTQTMKKEFPVRLTEFLNRGDYQGAYQLIAVAQERYPKSAELRFIRAMVILEEGSASGNPEQFLSVAKNTETILQSISNEGARVSGFHNMLGMALFAQGKTDEALDHYAKALSLAPSYIPAYLSTAAALESKGELSYAEKYYRRVVELVSAYASKGAIDNEDAGKKFLAVGYFGLARTAWYAEHDKKRAQEFAEKALGVKTSHAGLNNSITAFQELIK